MKRRVAREVALQTLFQMDFSDITCQEALKAVCLERELAESATDFSYSNALLEGTLENITQIDEMISKYAQKWKISRMAGVDRNLLRLAVYELLFAQEKLKANIVINEAIEIAKIYGNDDSSRFINGILGKIANETKQQ